MASLDVLRGFALFGILIVNILDYAPEPASTADAVTKAAVGVLAQGTFYPLFALLFGVGFAVFLGRAEASGAHPLVLYTRRLVGLLAVAVFQWIFLEDRNILLRYSIWALPLLLFWRASARMLLAASLCVMVLAVARDDLHRALLAREASDPERAAVRASQQAANRLAQQQRFAAYQDAAASRSYRRMVMFRAEVTLKNQLRTAVDVLRNGSLLVIFAMFLLGAALWRGGVFTTPQRYQSLLGPVAVLGGMIGIGGNVLLSVPDQGPAWMGVGGAMRAGMEVASNVALTLTYGSAILLTIERKAIARCLVAPLAAIGRLGLTNYLWQSVAMGWLFLPYGAALEGTLPYSSLPLIAAAIFAVSWLGSVWWLTMFRFGPAEWLWRSFTYARLQPLRVQGTRTLTKA